MHGYFAALADVYWDDPDAFEHLRVMRVRAASPRSTFRPSHYGRERLFGRPSPCDSVPAALPQQCLQRPSSGRLPAGSIDSAGEPWADAAEAGLNMPPGRPGAGAEEAQTRRSFYRHRQAAPGRPVADAGHPQPRPHASHDPGARGHAARPFGLVYRKLFPDPGLYFRVPFGGFTRELSGQAAAPHRLAPAQGIDCLLQIYQIHRPIPKTQIAYIETGDEANQHLFHLLTPQKERLLGVDHIIGPASGHQALPPQSGRPTRLFRLTLAMDPSMADHGASAQDFLGESADAARQPEESFGNPTDQTEQPGVHPNAYNGDEHA